MPKYQVRTLIEYIEEVWAEDESAAEETGWHVEGKKEAYASTYSIEVEELEPEEDEDDPFAEDEEDEEDDSDIYTIKDEEEEEE